MRPITIDKGVDLIIDILRQSQAIRTSLQENEGNDTLDIRENEDSLFSYNSRVSLVRSDTDGQLILSRRGQDINGQKREKSYQEAKDLIESILNRMTAQDYKSLSDEGFQVEELTVKSLAANLQLIKDYQLSIETNNIYGMGENYKEDIFIDGELLDLTEEKIIKRLEKENLPFTKETIEEIKGALKLSEGIPHMRKKDILYMLQIKLPPTIENIYKARYSSRDRETVKRLSDGEWNEMVAQVNEIVNAAGVKAGTDILKNSRDLIENNIPLTTDNIKKMIDLGQLADKYDKNKIFDTILKGMKEGLGPEEVPLIQDNENGPISLVENINRISDHDIVNTVVANKDITIYNLVKTRISSKEKIQDEDFIDEEQALEDLTGEQRVKATTAKRQLEEIRLKMTLEAARGLEKKGFKIETETLERVVDRLRQEEEIYYKELYNQAGVEADEDMVQTLRDTSQGINELKSMPIKVLGLTLKEARSQTISSLLHVARSIEKEAKGAMEVYEALLTRPKAEYGDSIRKAFANMDSLIEEMGIEKTEYNQRAIRILAYNQMDINMENIEEVKAYDLKVTYLIENLNPSIAIQLIKTGLNPMKMPIDDLNRLINGLKDQGYSSLEKYSTYLHRLDKEGNISESERKAYIGIYRLLYQIKKSDGAALGALIKSKQKISLNHLLSSLRSMKMEGMDYRIDDEFGVLEDISYSRENISEQLKSVFNNDPVSNEHDNEVQGQTNIKESYQNEIQEIMVGELLDKLTPYRLAQIHKSMENYLSDSKDGLVADAQVWDTIGNMSIEQLLDQIKNMEVGSEINYEYYNEKLQELKEIYNNSDQAIRFLDDFKLPCTTINLMMADQILNNNGTVFKRLFGLAKDKGDENDKKQEKSLEGLKESLELSDNLIDSKTMNEAYEKLDQEVKALIEDEAISAEMDFSQLSRLKAMGKQIHFIKNLASREFYQIPLESAGKLTTINLTIIRGKGSEGKVTTSLRSESLGSIKAEARIKDNKMSIYIVCDNVKGLKLLEAETDLLKAGLQDDDINIKKPSFCLQQSSENIYTYKKSWDSEEDKGTNNERILYKTAKIFINMIRSAEDQVK